MKKHKYLAEVMKTSEYKEIKERSGIVKLIVGGTGIGKSVFIINELIRDLTEGAFANNVLLLANRSTLVAQHKADLKQAEKNLTNELVEEVANRNMKKAYGDRVKVMTYHSLPKVDKDFLSKFKFVICDEAHFIVQDATYNEECDDILRILMERRASGAELILVTATEFELLPTLWLNGISVEKGNLKIYDYNKVINWYDRIDLFFTSKRVDSLALRVPHGEKCMIFTDKSKMKSLCKKLEDADYIHSKWVKGKQKDVAMEKKQQQLVEDKKFHTKYLIANSALDNGISIEDVKFTTMIIDNVHDLVQIIQMIGRKRFNEVINSDRLKVYIVTNYQRIKREYDGVLFQIQMYNDYLQMQQDYKVEEPSTYPIVEEFNRKYQECWESEKLNVIKKDTSGITARFLVRETYLAKIGFKRDLYCRLNQITFDINDYYSAKMSFYDFRNVNYQYAKQIVERYDKSINDVIIDKGKALKTLSEKEEIRSNRANRLPVYLEGFLNYPIQLYSDIHQQFIHVLYKEYSIGDGRGQSIRIGSINTVINDLGYYISAKTVQKNKKRITYWILSRIEDDGAKLSA